MLLRKHDTVHQTKENRDRSNMLKTVEYRHFRALRLIYIIVLSLFVLAAGQAAFFLYTTVYGGIDDVESILTLHPQTTADVIDFGLLETVEEAWNTKYNRANEPLLSRDPFTSVPPPAAPAEGAPL